MSRLARLAAAVLVTISAVSACSIDATVQVDRGATGDPVGDADGTEERNPGGYAAYGIYTRVNFAQGSVGTTIEDAVVRGTVNGYLFAARAGQQMRLTLTSLEDNAVVEVFGPDDDLLAQGTDAALELPADGDYLVVISSERGNATFELEIEIR